MTNQNQGTTIDTLVNQATLAISVAESTPMPEDGYPTWDDLDAPAKTAIALALGEVRNAIARLDEAKAALEDIIRTKTPGPENAEDIGEFRIAVTQSSTLDKAAFMAAHPPAKFPNLYEYAPKTAEINKAFAPAELDLYKKPSKPSVSFKAL